jgi:prephenate dehydratase
MENYPVAAQHLVSEMVAEATARPSAAIAFQGAPGCNGHNAVRKIFPDAPALPCFTFEDALDAVREARAGRAVIPIENALHGRVADIHFLLPESGLSIEDEYFMPIQHSLLGRRSTSAPRVVLSHPQALGQCRHTLKALNIRPVAFVDTAAAAAHIATLEDDAVGALAPPIAATLYGLAILNNDLSDANNNVTRFLILTLDPTIPSGPGPWLTTILFEVRSVPAALFKALSGFATNGVNMTKLESYHAPGRFTATQFFCDIEGHPHDEGVQEAMRDLLHQSEWVRVLGTYRNRRQSR